MVKDLTQKLDDDLIDPPVAERAYQLVVLSGPAQGRIFNLPGGDATEFRIGKDPGNDLVLADPAVSRTHCVVRRDRDSWVLVDLDSTNGTFLGDVRIRESYLSVGATLRVGQSTIRFTSDLAPLVLPPSEQDHFGPVVGSSLRMREIFALLERVSQTDSTVLMTGETGTGKGAVAHAVHQQSRRAAGPFVVVDCAAVAPTLIESELFGHERGAFTGAAERRVGALEQADGGTLFLDELDDLRTDLQAKLLRALEERTFQRLGAPKPTKFDARVIGATKKNLRALVAKSLFREDLYYRLAIFHVELPPLRQHKEDLPTLVDHFATALGHPGTWAKLSAPVRNHLLGHSWPGNVRELRNVVERALGLGDAQASQIGAWHLDPGVAPHLDPLQIDYSQRYKEAKELLNERFEREYVTRLLARCEGNVMRAAREAGIDRSYLYILLKKHGLAAREE